MTLRDRGKLGNRAVAEKAAERAETVRLLIAQGKGLKHAAWEARVSVRTARRYRQRWQG